jgi:acetamidase/formamidase
VHICTGPVAVKDAKPGDVLQVRILDVKQRVLNRCNGSAIEQTRLLE